MKRKKGEIFFLKEIFVVKQDKRHQRPKWKILHNTGKRRLVHYHPSFESFQVMNAAISRLTDEGTNQG